MVTFEDAGELTNTELELKREQEPVLKKLNDLGYGLYIEKDFYMALPSFLDKENFPLDLYHGQTDKKVVARNWDELVKLSGSSGNTNK